MSNDLFKNAIALTGGISTGKSTVCNLFKLHGFLTIDADKIAHRLLDENSHKIATMFGEQYVENGKVLRKELGKIIFSNDKEQLFADLRLVGTKFWIAMPFKFGHNTSILASKKYHPTADLNLQRADLLDGLDYYSSEIQLASFVFPAGEHRELTGIAKR